MRKLLCVFSIGCSVIISGCSSVSTGEYFVENSMNTILSDNHSDWVSDTIQPSFGKLRPPLKMIKLTDAERDSFVVYPIIINEKDISFGPVLFPIIPVLSSWQDPPSEYIGRIRLLFKGSHSEIEGLEMFVDGKPISAQVFEEGDCLLIMSDALQNTNEIITVIIKLRECSQTLRFQRERTFCYVPFTSFN